MKAHRFGVAGALAASSLLFVVEARADGRAEQLFQEARALGEKGRYAEACPLLEESQSLEPAIGTQFNLADCWEHVGRTASAHELFSRVAETARAAGRFEREKSARERAHALEPKLAKVAVTFAAEAPGETLEIDKRPIAKAAWAKPIAVDPGTHEIVASAPDHKPFRTSVVAKEASTADVKVPALVDTRPPIVRTEPEKRATQRTIALVVGGAGVAGLAVGAITGAMAISAKSDGEASCPKDPYAFRCPTQEGADAWNRAETMGTISTVGFIAGGVLLAGGVVLWLTAPKAKTTVGTAPKSFVLGGTF